jgi:hypothetical protein
MGARPKSIGHFVEYPMFDLAWQRGTNAEARVARGIAEWFR